MGTSGSILWGPTEGMELGEGWVPWAGGRSLGRALGRVERVSMGLGVVKPRQGLTPSSCSALGSLVVGMSCVALQELGREDFLGALRTLYVQPRSLPASLVRRRLCNPCGSQAACPCPALKAWCPQRRCVQEEVLRRPALSEEEMAWLGPRFLMELP